LPAAPELLTLNGPLDRGGAFVHLRRMSDDRGLFEHASGTMPRREHGYCTDDNARLLVVTLREPDEVDAQQLGEMALEFVLGAQASNGFRNRMDETGRWTDDATTDDCWGRALWSLGTAAICGQHCSVRDRARNAFHRGALLRSEWTRSMAFAALGAADVVGHDPSDTAARALLSDYLDMIPPTPPGRWAWPEERLRYANAVIAEAMIAAGAALHRPLDVERGLAMLGWLLTRETSRGHLSVTGVGGRGIDDDDAPQFDQQPIEVAAMADACWRGWSLTGDERWRSGVHAASAWFDGENDCRLVMTDVGSGGGFDGLHADRVNLNQGAESTLAMVSTKQRERSV
jgi:hypothetical protein